MTYPSSLVSFRHLQITPSARITERDGISKWNSSSLRCVLDRLQQKAQSCVFMKAGITKFFISSEFRKIVKIKGELLRREKFLPQKEFTSTD